MADLYRWWRHANTRARKQLWRGKSSAATFASSGTIRVRPILIWRWPDFGGVSDFAQTALLSIGIVV
jgi:hypothetical protein